MHTHLPTVSIDLKRRIKNMRLQKSNNTTITTITDIPPIARSHTQKSIVDFDDFPIFFSWRLHGQWKKNKNCDRKRNFHRVQKSEERIVGRSEWFRCRESNENYRIRHGFQWCSADNNFFLLHSFFFLSVWNLTWMSARKKSNATVIQLWFSKTKVNETNKEKERVETWLKWMRGVNNNSSCSSRNINRHKKNPKNDI